MSIRVTRRNLLTLFGASFFSLNVFERLVEAADKQVSFFASAYMDQQKRYGIAIVDQYGQIFSRYLLPNRGHGMAFSTTSGRLVVFARRPSNFAMAVDMYKKQEPVLFHSPSHTHFYGHGVFARDGKLLFATENEFEKGEGLIGIYDATNEFARVGEISSHGIGPHEVIIMPDGHTLCIANGGILTHPDSGRAKLNLHEMQSSIVFIDSLHGELIAKFDVPQHIQRLSLRHMAIDHNKTVWFGGQYKGDGADQAPLIATANLEFGLEFPDIAPVQELGLANYIGSVASKFDGQEIAFSSPIGNTFLSINVQKKTVSQKRSVNQVCGISSTQSGFLTTSHSGEINQLKKAVYWDNHITKVQLNSLLSS